MKWRIKKKAATRTTITDMIFSHVHIPGLALQLSLGQKSDIEASLSVIVRR